MCLDKRGLVGYGSQPQQFLVDVAQAKLGSNLGHKLRGLDRMPSQVGEASMDANLRRLELLRLDCRYLSLDGIARRVVFRYR